ncbi:cytochrome P450 [Solirubrobacter soli]|uniref:cytochrome P450 n=1 Tax=Solirubrobacter soli TaxID=363832 RepID=UPI00040A373C|nr:cytochrome P450 [Solirubrobacter soli]
MRDGLPPGPKEPAALQTVEWIIRPTALLRRAQARYGEPFTLNTVWMDAPLVLTSDPQEIKRIYAAPPDVLQAGDSSSIMEPFVGPNSVLILHGEEHLKQRRLMLPPFHGEQLRKWAATVSEITHAELDTWPAGTTVKTLPRMQAITLEVIQRVIFGSRDHALKDALRTALDMTGSMPNLIAMALLGPHKRFTRAVARIDELVYARIDDATDGDSILTTLKAAGATRQELRDQLVTLLAAGHETTATALAWACERLAREQPPLDTDQDIDAFVKHVLTTRPVLSITARKTLQPYSLQGHTIPKDVYVAACIYLAHRRPDAPYIPFGGGTRRCLGAAFATLEMREVIRAINQRFTLAPDRPEGERMRRRSVVLAPSREGSIIPTTR